jgi:hypothetical protein
MRLAPGDGTQRADRSCRESINPNNPAHHNCPEFPDSSYPLPPTPLIFFFLLLYIHHHAPKSLSLKPKQPSPALIGGRGAVLLGREAELVFEPILGDYLKNKESTIDGCSLKKSSVGRVSIS